MAGLFVEYFWLSLKGFYIADSFYSITHHAPCTYRGHQVRRNTEISILGDNSVIVNIKFLCIYLSDISLKCLLFQVDTSLKLKFPSKSVTIVQPRVLFLILFGINFQDLLAAATKSRTAERQNSRTE